MRALLSALLTFAIAAPATEQTAPPAAPIVTNVSVAGDVVDAVALQHLIKIKIGAPYDPVAVRRTLELLYTKGPFVGIEVEQTPSPGGVALTFRFQRQLLLDSWQFHGNAHLDSDTLARALGLTWGQAANADAFARSAQAIHDRYTREGFLHATATMRVVPERAGMAKLLVNVQEGKPLTVSSVQVPLSGPFKPKEVENVFGMHAGDRLVRDKVFQGLTNLNDALERQAYLNGRVTQLFVLPDGSKTASYQDVLNANPDHVGLLIAIDAGQKGVVAVKGDVLLPAITLSKAVSVYRDRSYSPAELDDSAAALEALYVAHGYPDAKVTHTLTRKADGSYSIVFEVAAGPHVTIKAIRFAGNHAIDDQNLLSTFETQPKHFLGGGVFVPSTWQKDLDTIPATYRARGFLSARVTGVDRLLDPKGNQLTLVVHVDEGPQSRVARILFPGANPLQEAGLLEALPINPGDAYNPDRLPDEISSIEAYYARTGYPLARVTGVYLPGQSPADGTLRFTVDPSTLKHLGVIVLTGNV
ncbi:MAG TPA: POTRA domain-containing protein, partial [Oscillatoriaceae cyanobacterium]